MKAQSYSFKLEVITDAGYSDNSFYLRTYKPDGSVYAVWGNSNNGYFNSQPATGDRCFSIGKTNKTNGQDIVNGAVWELIPNTDGKFAIKNIGTGKYLKDANTAKYDDPTYFTLCTLKKTIKYDYYDIKNAVESIDDDATVYTGEATLDISAAESSIATATTTEEVSVAINKLREAANSFVTSVTVNEGKSFDLTKVYLVNSDFDSGNTDGWTKDTPYGGNCAIQGGSHMEYWAGNASDRGQASFNIYQELTGLPNGAYTISADMYNSLNDEGGNYTTFSSTCCVYGSSNNEEVALVTEDGTTLNTYTTDEVLVFNGRLIVGTKNTTTPIAARWFVFDNVKLNYTRKLTQEEIDANTLPESISLDESSVNLTIYGTKTLVPTILPNNANDKSVSWTSSNNNVATVDINGKITAVGVGTATITASANAADNVTATATITVADVTPAAAPAYYSEIAAGEFYILNAATGEYLGGANDWGTRASIIKHGIPFTVAASDGKYTLDSKTENGNKHFFDGTYIDAASTSFYITALGNGKYSISNANGSAFVTAKAKATGAIVDNTAINANSTLAQWYFVSKENRDALFATATPEDPADATHYINDANFSRNHKKGWTGDYTRGGDNPNFNAMVHNNAANVYQAIENIPNGVYQLKMQGCTTGTATLWANNESVAILTNTGDVTTQQIASYAFSDAKYTDNTLNVTITDNKLNIAVKSDDTDKTLYFDNFELYYLRELTDVEVAEAALKVALAEAHAIEEGSIPDAAYSNLQNSISINDISEGSADQFNTATQHLNEAIAAALALVDPYAAWKELKPYADDLVAVSTNNAEENATLASAISTQNTAVEAAMTADAITTATTTLKEAMVTYATTAEPTNNECFDLTFMIVNPHFTEGTADNPTGWTVNYPEAPANQWAGAKELRISTHNFEAYHKQFTLSQTIANMQKGTYKVTLQGFARHDDANVTDKTYLFCGDGSQPIKDINSEYSTTSLIAGKPDMGDTNGEKNENGKYWPNGMSASYYWFQEENPLTHQPFYTSEVPTLLAADGNLTIGFKCETWSDWVIWDNFHLYYYGTAIAVTIDENEAASVYENDIENANVTLKRTIKAKGETGIWNTIFLPFSLTDTETKAAFGSDTEIANYSEAADGNTGNSTVNFTLASSAAIAANTPVLLRTSTAGTSYSFSDVNIKAGEAKVAGTNFDFVGTYAASTTIAEGDYFLSSNKLYRSKGTTTIKGTRAYIKAKATSEARIEKFFIDGIEATNIEGLTVAGAADGKIYNLNGQEVKAPKKGLYIQNGKKISIK